MEWYQHITLIQNNKILLMIFYTIQTKQHIDWYSKNHHIIAIGICLSKFVKVQIYVEQIITLYLNNDILESKLRTNGICLETMKINGMSSTNEKI